jgi:hypothetical protein
MILWEDATFICVSMLTRVCNIRSNKRLTLEYTTKSYEIP